MRGEGLSVVLGGLVMFVGCHRSPAPEPAAPVGAATASLTPMVAGPGPGECSLLVRMVVTTVPAEAVPRLGLNAFHRRGVAVDDRGRGASYRLFGFDAYARVVQALTELDAPLVAPNYTWRMPLEHEFRTVSPGPPHRRAALALSTRSAGQALAVEVTLDHAPSYASVPGRTLPRSLAGRRMLAPTEVVVEEPATLVLFAPTSRREHRYVLAAIRYRMEPGCPTSGRTPIGQPASPPDR